jgi:hypothetical protein
MAVEATERELGILWDVVAFDAQDHYIEVAWDGRRRWRFLMDFARPRKLAVAATTDRVILPIYADLAAAAETLRTATGALAAQPSLVRLEEAQQAWRAAHTL